MAGVVLIFIIAWIYERSRAELRAIVIHPSLLL
jgi:hypothetical protein